MFFDVLFLLWMCNNNIDSDPGVDFENLLAGGQKLGEVNNSFFFN